MHAIEELDHADQPGRDVDFVENVGVIGLDPRNTKHIVEACGESKEPHQGTHKCREEAFALLQKAQALPPYDADRTNEILPGREAGGRGSRGIGRCHFTWSAWRNGHAPRQLSDLDRLEDLERCDIDQGDIVRHPISADQQLFIRRERQLPNALTDQEIVFDLEGLAVDHRNAVAGPARRTLSFHLW